MFIASEYALYLLLQMFLLYTDAVHFLLKKGAGVNVRNNDGLTALHIAAETDNLPLCKELVNKGADVTAVCTSSKVRLLQFCI